MRDVKLDEEAREPEILERRPPDIFAFLRDLAIIAAGFFGTLTVIAVCRFLLVTFVR